MGNKYFMAEETDDTLEIVIYGDITSYKLIDSDVSAYSIEKLISESNAKNIIVKINSYGGEVAEAIAICNSLKAKEGVKVKTIDMGFACSAASLIFCAGDERIMENASLLMIHNPWIAAAGDAGQLRKAADDLDVITEAVCDIYRNVMTISDDELKAMMDAESWITAADAVEYGFATGTEAYQTQEQAAAKIKTSVFQMIKKDPGKKVPEKKPNNIFKNFRKE